MTPASAIIERCGGNKTVAEWLNLDRTAVQRWTYDPPKGTGEQVPMKHWSALIEAARRNGIEISVAELMPAEVARMVAEDAAQGAAA